MSWQGGPTVCTGTCIYVQSLRQGKGRQLCLKTTTLFPKRKSCLRQDSNLCTRQTLYQLSHLGRSAGQAESLNVIQGRAKAVYMCAQICVFTCLSDHVTKYYQSIGQVCISHDLWLVHQNMCSFGGSKVI